MVKLNKVRYYEYGDVLLKRVKGEDCDGCYFYEPHKVTTCHICSSAPLNTKYVEGDKIDIVEYKLKELQRLRKKHQDFFDVNSNQDMNITININL